MNASRLLGSQYRVIKMARRIVAVACIFSSAPLLAQSTPTQFSSTGAEGVVSFTFPVDNCRSGFGFINVAANGSTSINASSTRPLANATIFEFDFCAGNFILFESGTGAIEFSAVGNGTQVPREINASGKIPMSFGSGQTDVLSFKLTLNSVGIPFESEGNVRDSFPFSPTASVSINEHFDSNSSAASVSLTASTQNLGALTISIGFGFVQSNKLHVLTITH